MPPPSKSEKDIGEKRVVNYTGVGLSIGKEIDVSSSGDLSGTQTEHIDSSLALSDYIWEKMYGEYKKISKYCDPKATSVDLIADGIRPVKPPSVPNFE